MVLYIVNPGDEYAVLQLPTFDGKKLKSVMKESSDTYDEEGLDVDNEDEKKERVKGGFSIYDENEKKKFEEISKFMNEDLGVKVEKDASSQLPNTAGLQESSVLAQLRAEAQNPHQFRVAACRRGQNPTMQYLRRSASF